MRDARIHGVVADWMTFKWPDRSHEVSEYSARMNAFGDDDDDVVADERME